MDPWAEKSSLFESPPETERPTVSLQSATGEMEGTSQESTQEEMFETQEREVVAAATPPAHSSSETSPTDKQNKDEMLETQAPDTVAAAEAADESAETSPEEKKNGGHAETVARNEAKEDEEEEVFQDPFGSDEREKQMNEEIPATATEGAVPSELPAIPKASAPKPILKKPKIAQTQSNTSQKIQNWLKPSRSTHVKISQKSAAKMAAATKAAAEAEMKATTLEKAKPETKKAISPAASRSPEISAASKSPKINLSPPTTDVPTPRKRKIAAKSKLTNKPPPKVDAASAKKSEPVRTPKTGKPPARVTTEPAPNRKRKAAAPGKTTKKRKSEPSTPTKARRASGAKANEVYRGPPDKEIEGGWPEGWFMTKEKRLAGGTKDREDRYWFPPGGKHKLRSMVECKRYMAALKESNGDADYAWNRRKA